MTGLSRKTVSYGIAVLIFSIQSLSAIGPVYCEPSAPLANPSHLDAQVSRFLKDARHSWRGWNVPYEDGKILHDLVIKGKFKHILEIGTSTGHSTIWLAWAASKTGGKVTTIEIDRDRYIAALENFRKSGVAPYIDARLADAHDLVRALKGPFDFVFCDADKEWYLQYFIDLAPKIREGGCYTAHNVLRGGRDVEVFLDYVKGDARFRTIIERGSGEGISISCRGL
jgi:predicted O-methyltransferase YrrM